MSAAGGTSSLAGGILPFPDPPKGSPGEIRSAARSLRLAAEEMQSAHGTLGASAGLLGGWEGEAAVAYRGCVQGLARIVHGGVASLHGVATVVQRYAGALDRAQSGIKRLRPLYDAAVRRAGGQAGIVSGLEGSLSGATKAERKVMVGLITSAARQAQAAVDEANGYARAARRLLDDFHREATADANALAPFDMALYGGTLGSPIGAPGPSFGFGGVSGDPASVLAPFSGVIPITLPSPKGPSLLNQILSGVQSVSGVVTSGAGACSALLFWNPIGDGCGVVAGVSSGIGAGAGVAKAIAGDGSVTGAVEGTVEALPGIASARLARSGEDLIIAGEGFGNHAVATSGYTKKAVSGILDGLGGTASARSIGELGSGGGGGHVSAGTIDRAAGRGIQQQLSEIEGLLAGVGPIG